MLAATVFGDHGGDRKSSSGVRLDDLGVTKMQSHRWQREAKVAEEVSTQGT